MKDLRQAPGQRAKAHPQQNPRLVDRLKIALPVDSASRRLRDGDGQLLISGTAAAIGEDGILARPQVSASRLTEVAAAGTRRSTRGRWLAAVRIGRPRAGSDPIVTRPLAVTRVPAARVGPAVELRMAASGWATWRGVAGR